MESLILKFVGVFMGICKQTVDIYPDRIWKLKTVKLFKVNKLKHRKNRAISAPVVLFCEVPTLIVLMFLHLLRRIFKAVAYHLNTTCLIFVHQ